MNRACWTSLLFDVCPVLPCTALSVPLIAEHVYLQKRPPPPNETPVVLIGYYFFRAFVWVYKLCLLIGKLLCTRI